MCFVFFQCPSVEEGWHASSLPWVYHRSVLCAFFAVQSVGTEFICCFVMCCVDFWPSHYILRCTKTVFSSPFLYTTSLVFRRVTTWTSLSCMQCYASPPWERRECVLWHGRFLSAFAPRLLLPRSHQLHQPHTNQCTVLM